MAVIVVLALIALVLIYIMATMRTFDGLGRELKLLDQRQTHRLQVISGHTNAPPSQVQTQSHTNATF